MAALLEILRLSISLLVSILTKKSIATYDLIAQPRVTQKLIDDSAINMEEWLASRLAQEFALAEENAFINGVGSGSNQPVGILNYSAGTTSTTIQRIESADTTDGDFDEDDILNLYYALSEKYVNRASFLMSRSAVQAVRKLKDATSRELTTRLKNMILSVDGDSEQKTINHFVDNELFAVDSKALRAYINEVIPDIDLTWEFVSEETGEGRMMQLPMDISFFWPES